MKIVLPGGSGQVGTVMARDFHRAGHEVIVLSRTPSAAPWKVMNWDGAMRGDWLQRSTAAMLSSIWRGEASIADIRQRIVRESWIREFSPLRQSALRYPIWTMAAEDLCARCQLRQ